MARPSKSVKTLLNEKKSHRTKAELAARQEGEEGIKSGKKLLERAEIKKDKQAHKEFLRLKKIYEDMDKADELYSAVINRYCALYSECLGFEQKRFDLEKMMAETQQKFDEKADKIKDEDALDYIDRFAKLMGDLYKRMLSFDTQIMQKRKMMFDIEKENIMTVASALRSIPKEPANSGESPLLKALASDD